VALVNRYAPETLDINALYSKYRLLFAASAMMFANITTKGNDVVYSFSALGRDINGNVSFTAEKNNDSSKPSYNSGNGCSITLIPKNGTVNEVNYTPAVNYNVDGGGDLSTFCKSVNINR
jgi:hypothetical protein